MSTTELTCPMCGTHLDIGHLIVAADERAAFLRVLELADPLKGCLTKYIYLFAPPKTALTQRKQARILLSLLPDLERRAIHHAGRDWAAPLKLWEQGIDQMLQARDAGRLELPLKGHGYLYTILSSLANKVEAAAETQTESQKRAPHQATVTVHGQPMPMGAALAQVFGGRDPTLARLDAEAGSATPMPAAARALLEKLKTSK